MSVDARSGEDTATSTPEGDWWMAEEHSEEVLAAWSSFGSCMHVCCYRRLQACQCQQVRSIWMLLNSLVLVGACSGGLTCLILLDARVPAPLTDGP